MRVLVTGGTGLIGTQLVEILKSNEFEVFASHTSHHPGFEIAQWCRIDLRDTKSVEQLIATVRPDAVICLAWNGGPSIYNDKENIVWKNATFRLIESFVKMGGQHVVCAGTCAEYDWSSGSVALKESAKLAGHATLYSESKARLRTKIENLKASYRFGLCWIRPFFIYGPYEAEHRLVPYFITSLLRGKQAICRSPNSSRDYLFSRDVASAIQALLLSRYDGIVNVGSGGLTRLGDLAELIGAYLGRPELVDTRTFGHVMGDEVLADTELIESMGWRPAIDINSGIEQTVEWWRQNYRHE